MPNLIDNIYHCQFFEQQISPVLIYYSHIPVAIIACIFGLYVLIQQRHSRLPSLFFVMNLLFALWVVNDLLTWILSDNGPVIMFAWSTLELIEVIFFYACLNFSYLFFFEKKIPTTVNLLLILPILPVFYYTVTGQVLENYNIAVCEATENQSIIHQLVFYTDLFYLFGVIGLYVWSILKNKTQNLFKNSVFFFGIIFFLILYITALYISDYIENYNWSLIALAGIPIFLGVIGFTAVRFKVFNFKILGAQLLVSLSIFLVASQFIFIVNPINRILNSVTLVILVGGGILLIRSVKKVDQQRELLDVANREQENLIHFISHQIKGFFTKSRNIFATIKDEEASIPEGLRTFIDEGLRSDNEGIKVVTDILNAANLKTGTVQFSKNVFYLNQLLEKIIANNKPMADKKGIALHYLPDSSMVAYSGDETRLLDAIGNIINNAVNYTFVGEITVSMLKKDDRIDIIVKDTGVGLTPEDKAKLFNSGGRGNESLKYNVNSTGYGLYIAKRVIEAHGGTIVAESAGRDKGSIFHITLPVRA